MKVIGHRRLLSSKLKTKKLLKEKMCINSHLWILRNGLDNDYIRIINKFVFLICSNSCFIFYVGWKWRTKWCLHFSSENFFFGTSPKLVPYQEGFCRVCNVVVVFTECSGYLYIFCYINARLYIALFLPSILPIIVCKPCP